jgi:hypothetical protein
MGAPGFTAYLMKIIHNLFPGGPEFFGDIAVFSLEKAGVNQLCDFIHGDIAFF